MAAVLDQATWAKIVLITNDEADPKELPKHYANLLDKGSLWERVCAIPEIWSEGKLQLKKNSPQVKSLGRLIRFRNALIHVREGMKEGEIEVPMEEFKKGNVPLKIDPPLYLWDRVSVSEAYGFRDSVKVYLHEVIEPEEIVPGKIISPV